MGVDERGRERTREDERGPERTREDQRARERTREHEREADACTTHKCTTHAWTREKQDDSAAHPCSTPLQQTLSADPFRHKTAQCKSEGAHKDTQRVREHTKTHRKRKRCTLRKRARARGGRERDVQERGGEGERDLIQDILGV